MQKLEMHNALSVQLLGNQSVEMAKEAGGFWYICGKTAERIITVCVVKTAILVVVKQPRYFDESAHFEGS